LQLFLHLGTWQLSDLVYNTVGGVLGGVVYFFTYKIAQKHRNKKKYFSGG
jgi:glycopeptide antibiotics resistance protein